MDTKSRSNLAVSIALIAAGVWILAIETVPAVKAIALGSGTWPFNILGMGALLALLALITWVPDLLLPACIVLGVGGMLYWQNTTGDWGSWAYAWTLIPGFVGFGMVLSGLLGRKRDALVGGGWAIFTSLVMFAIFAAFLAGKGWTLQYWPLAVIVLGVLILVQGLFQQR
ncbi:MAG TPA: hypothetical protein VF498_06815 [Anaerolineales bacterium]